MGTPNDLYRLLYTSECKIEGPADRRARAVHRITEQSRSNNRGQGLTGVLLYVQNSFIQVLEGPAEQLETTFERICCDFRHGSLRLVDLTPVKARLFADWDMALVEGATGEAICVTSEIEEISFLVGVNAREAMRQMRTLLDRVPA